MRERRFLWLLMLGKMLTCSYSAEAQKPEYRYYSWGNLPPDISQLRTEYEAEPRVLSDTRLIEYSSGTVYVLIHRKVYYQSWKALQAHRRESFPGKLLDLKARLWDDSGNLLKFSAHELIVIDSQQQGGGVMLFGIRRPGAVLEYLWVTEMPHSAYLSQWYPMPMSVPVKLTLIHPPELVLQYGISGMQASAERQNRDGKVFTALFLQRTKDTLPSGAVFPCGLRIIMRKNRPGDVPGWEDAAAQVYRSMAQTLSKRQVKALNSVYRQAKRLQPASQLQILAALPALFRKYHLTYNHALMLRLLSLLSIEHQMVWTCDRLHRPPDTNLPYLPDMTAMFLYIPGAGRYFSNNGTLLEAVPDDFVACSALFIPSLQPDKPFWGSLPKPTGIKNRDIGELLFSGDSIFQFRRVYSGRNAEPFQAYGRLTSSMRAETDISICREMLPEAWLLDCRTGRNAEGEMAFEGVCVARKLVDDQDSLLKLNLSQLLMPTSDFSVTPGMIWERSLIIPTAKFSLAEGQYLRDTTLQQQAIGLTTSFRVRKEEKWMVFTYSMNALYRCVPDKTATGSLRLPVTIMLRKNKK